MPRKTWHPFIGRSPIRALASMRPRPDAAENGRQRRPIGDRPASFNEAAARCRGKLPHARTGPDR